MARREYQVVDLRDGRPSNTGAAMDAAMKGLQIWAQTAGKKRQEEKAAESLTSYIAGLPSKEQTTIMAKLAAEAPNVFSKVAAKLPSPKEDPMEVARRTGILNEIRYNPTETREQFDGAKHMMRDPSSPDPNRAVAPAVIPAGYEDITGLPMAEQASVRTARQVYSLGDVAGGAPMVGQVNRSVLDRGDQTHSMRVLADVAPKADVVATQEGANSRAKLNADVTREGHRVQTANSIRTNRERAADRVQRAKGTQPTSADARAAQRRVDDIDKEIRDIEVKLADRAMNSPSNDKKRQTLNNQLRTLRFKKLPEALSAFEALQRNPPPPPPPDYDDDDEAPVPSAAVEDTGDEYAPEVESAIEATMSAKKQTRAQVIADLRKDPRTKSLVP